MALITVLRNRVFGLALTGLALVLASSHALSQQSPSPIQMAITTLQIAHPLPPGWTVELGSTEDNAPAETDAEKKRITINPAGIHAALPSVSLPQANLPGVLYIFLLHEWFHAQECHFGPGLANGLGYPAFNTNCGEICLQPGVAAEHCALIQAVLSPDGNGNVTALCAAYNAIAKAYNEGTNNSGGALAAWIKNNCTGTFPGAIPPCPGCP